jgi:hypothetical protein
MLCCVLKMNVGKRKGKLEKIVGILNRSWMKTSSKLNFSSEPLKINVINRNPSTPFKFHTTTSDKTRRIDDERLFEVSNIRQSYAKECRMFCIQ